MRRISDMSNGAHKYGEWSWCIKTKLSESGETTSTPTASSSLRRNFWTDPSVRKPAPAAAIFFQTTLQTLALAGGQWTAVFAASCMDGHAVAVDHWNGEVVL
jgi:hypothetical protein